MNQWQCARTSLKSRHSQATLDRPALATAQASLADPVATLRTFGLWMNNGAGFAAPRGSRFLPQERLMPSGWARVER